MEMGKWMRAGAIEWNCAIRARPHYWNVLFVCRALNELTRTGSDQNAFAEPVDDRWLGCLVEWQVLLMRTHVCFESNGSVSFVNLFQFTLQNPGFRMTAKPSLVYFSIQMECIRHQTVGILHGWRFFNCFIFRFLSQRLWSAQQTITVASNSSRPQSRTRHLPTRNPP